MRSSVAPVFALIAAKRINAGTLIHVLPKYRLHNQPAVYALYAGRTAVSPKMSVFLDFLGELPNRVVADPSIVKL